MLAETHIDANHDYYDTRLPDGTADTKIWLLGFDSKSPISWNWSICNNGCVKCHH